MIAASRFGDSPGVFAGIVEIAVAGLCLVKGMTALRRHFLVWHQEAQEADDGVSRQRRGLTHDCPIYGFFRRKLPEPVVAPPHPPATRVPPSPRERGFAREYHDSA